MQKKTLIPLLFFVLVSSSILPIFINNVKATSYNWLENSGFENALQYIMNPDFELGNASFWQFDDITDIITDVEPYYGDYHLRLGNLGDGCYQTLGINATITEIDNLSFWAKKSTSASSHLYFYVYYANTTLSTWQKIYDITLTETYTLYLEDIITDIPDNDGWVYKIEFSYGSGTGYQYIDNVVLGVNGELGGGQTDIDVDTTPWYSQWTLFGESGYIGITDNEANTGYFSAYLTYPNSDYKNNMYFQQNINFLSTDNVTDIGCYAKTDSSSNVVIRCTLTYSDWTTEAKHTTEQFNDTSNWVNFNFTFTTTGKLIWKFVLSIISGDYGDRTYFDDCFIYADVPPSTGQRFTWYTIPDMTYDTPISARATTLTNYVFYGTFYDVDGLETDSGTFDVVHSKGTTEGTISYGKFNFDIPLRDNTYDGKGEYFTLNLHIDSDGIYTFKIGINWFKSLEPSTSDNPNPYIDPTQTYNTVDLIINFLFLFVPALFFGTVCYKSEAIDPIVGIICGLLLSSFLYYTVFGNILGVVICVLTIGTLILVKRGGYI